jgi:hypothetical protein
MSSARFVEPARERGHFLHASGEAIDGERPMERFMMWKRCRTGAVATMMLDADERAARGAEHTVEVVAVFRRACGADRQRQLAKAVAERVNAHRRAYVFADGARFVRAGATEHDDEMLVDESHVIVAAQEVACDLGHGGQARFLADFSTFYRIDRTDQDCDG